MLDLCLIILFCFLGYLVGIGSGLLPGLHVNTIALILLSVAGSIVALCSPLSVYGISEEFILLLIAGFIVATSISHSFHDSIPTTFLGAPEENTALSVLPAHSLLLKGNGYEAVFLAVLGSYGAIVVCLCIFYPIKFLIGDPLMLYASLRKVMAYVLIAILIFMIATEKAKIYDFGKMSILPSVIGILFAAFVTFLSGIFGLFMLDFPVDSPIGFSAPVLFPALSGLFGMPSLIDSIRTKPVIPQQKVSRFILFKEERKPSIVSTITGSLAGIFVSIIPGVTSATGTVLAMAARGEKDKKQTIITLSAVNTAASFFIIVVLFVILRAGSGVAIAVNELLVVETWTSIELPTNLTYLLMFVLLSGAFSFFSTLALGKIFARNFTRIPYERLVQITIAIIVALVFLSTGIFGLLVLMVATFIGFLPVLWGVRRSHCMGVLLIPIILYFL